MWYLPLSCLLKVALSLWTSALNWQQLHWWLYAPWVHQYNCIQNFTLLLLLLPLVLLSFIPFLLVLFNWVHIYIISVFICCIFCRRWSNICVYWLIAFDILMRLSALSSYVDCKTLERPYTTCATIFSGWKPASTTCLSARSLNSWWAVQNTIFMYPKFCQLYICELHSWRPILYRPVLLIFYKRSWYTAGWCRNWEWQ